MKKIFTGGWILLLFGWLNGQIINMDRPAKGKWDLQMQKIWERENAGETVFGNIQQVEVNAEGRMFLLDSKNFKIFIFDKEGKFISSFGQKGEGPGEIRNLRMGNQLFACGNSIIVVDRGRIHYFTPEGIFKNTVLFPGQLKPRDFVSEDLFISAPVTVDDPKNQVTTIQLFDLKKKQETAIATYKPFEKSIAKADNRGNQLILAIVIDEITPMMLIKYHQGIIYYGMNNQYHINRVNLEGEKVGSFGIEGREPKKISPAYKKELEQRFSDVPRDMVKTIIDGLPEITSYFNEIAIDRNRFIYIFLSDPEGKSRKAVDILSPQGIYLYSSEIRVDRGLTIKNFNMKNDWLFVATEDEDGNQKVTKYILKLPHQ